MNNKTTLQKKFEEQTPSIKGVTSKEYLQTYCAWLEFQLEKPEEISPEETLGLIFKNNNEVKVVKTKRIKNNETFYTYSWEVNGTNSLGWWGFNTLDECVDDCIGYLAIRDYEPTTK